mmetsp:Transcript_26269/g.31868  ORF Transcript_26269/g.31868 Transcript_26269/m.31868 type:complete len:111 (-) Transcript_26269:205-537(-)
MTYSKYDQTELSKLCGRVVFTAFCTSMLHIGMGIVKPLLFQSVMMPCNILSEAVFKVNYWGYSDQQEDLKRPFVPPSVFDGWKKKKEEDKKEEKKEEEKKEEKPEEKKDK